MKVTHTHHYRLLGVVVISILLYLRSIWNEYAFDDLIHIEQNAGLNSWGTLLYTALAPIFPGDLFRPTTVLINGAVRILCGASPLPQHVVNVLIHAANTTLLSVALSKLHIRYANLIALLWAALPIHLEVVANCTGRAELLACFFGLLAFTVSEKATLKPLHRSIVISVLLTLSFGAKESGVVWILPVIAMGIVRRREIGSRGWIGPLLALLLVGMLRIVAFDGSLPSPNPAPLDNPLITLPDLMRRAFALSLLGRYAISAFFPLSVGADYSWGYFLPNPSMLLLATYLGVSLLLLIFAYTTRKSNPLVSAGIAWFFIAFLPTSNLIIPIGTIFGDRLAYTPTIGLVLALGALPLSKQSAAYIALFGAVASIIVWSNIPIWTNNNSLFTHQRVVSLSSVKTKVNVAVIERNKGHLTRAERLLQRALVEYPDYAEAQFNLAYIAFSRGNSALGHKLLTKTLEMNPALPEALNLAGRLALNENRLGDAFALFKRLIDSDPYSTDGHIGLLAIAINSGDAETAGKLLARLDTIAPGNKEVGALRGSVQSEDHDAEREKAE